MINKKPYTRLGKVFCFRETSREGSSDFGKWVASKMKVFAFEMTHCERASGRRVPAAPYALVVQHFVDSEITISNKRVLSLRVKYRKILRFASKFMSIEDVL
ncbi:hypothetical protein EVAR_2566_1 [Eumeta japonica]|uniref:Uncharacterized protein n=1 Tax=Eumeta variegata TaxID=151549 RepID=A0A4C1SLS1_EUMVA|nr:hypothetical protein EVAR_2566_1 [Eumeta japonica]